MVGIRAGKKLVEWGILCNPMLLWRMPYWYAIEASHKSQPPENLKDRLEI